MHDLQSSYDVVVIGGGHNGLACAALLAKAGHSVAVFERSPLLGGAAVSEQKWNGYTVSVASYVCTLLDPWLIAELQLESHGYSAYRKDPSSFNVLADGRSLLLGPDAGANAREIGAFDRADVAGYEALDALVGQLGSELFETFSDADPRFESLPTQSRAILNGSVAELVEKYVRTPVLQAAAVTDGLVGTFLGPRDAGTGYVLAHHAAGRALGVQGAWGYVRGGMGAISQALASVARAHGATLFTDMAVTGITVKDDRATGVVLAGGREITARAIASNAHPRTTFCDLVGEQFLDETLLKKLRAWKTTGPSFKLNLAIGELPNFLCRPGTHAQAHHRASIHVAPSIDYLQTAYEDAAAGGVSKQPMLECFLQTPTEPELAPPRKHILSIFAQYYPYNSTGGWTDAKRSAIADDIVARLAEFAPNLPSVIEERQILSAKDLEDRFGLVGGHIFHGELLPGQIYEDRFHTQTPIPNLYLCGSGAHPGGCVSGLPGKRAASRIQESFKATSAR
ncbi:MAG: NAD(P)/FAD-dependent oxidoreductase [Candidatus Eremiobacteraeota bacterium]|nr:NAD(P)/FAD-dependent oxidoreductase [Candidatus Eremiobacteraeota bacterium]